MCGVFPPPRPTARDFPEGKNKIPVSLYVHISQPSPIKQSSSIKLKQRGTIDFEVVKSILEPIENHPWKSSYKYPSASNNLVFVKSC